MSGNAALDAGAAGAGTGSRVWWWRAALSGLLAVAVMLGVGELLAAVIPGGRSHVVAVGDEVIDAVPGWVERAAIARLGHADKPALIISILAVSALLGAAVGVVAALRFVVGALGVALMAAVGAAASLADTQGNVSASIAVGVLSAIAGGATLWLLVSAVTAGRNRAPVGVRLTPAVAPAVRAAMPIDRRRFLALAGAAAVVAGFGVLGARLLTSSERMNTIRKRITLPRPFRSAPPPPRAASLPIPGLSPLFTPNRRFYRIDTALAVPQIDPADWSLQVRGLVVQPLTLTYLELMAMPQIEADITLTCVSNEVGGDLISNARWQGVPIIDLLNRARPHFDATQIVGRSVDGFTAGFPTVQALEQKQAMVAVAMNGEPLPTSHGFPARLVVPGLYGYVSATKWLAAIELTRLEDFDGYWIPRGWAKEGPIKTQSRIDVPATSSIAAGRQTIAGVAWAPTRGIKGVEVRVDDGPWQPATLAAELATTTWRQWFLRWEAHAGKHVISVRATDTTGETQTDKRHPPAPNGATGYHTIEVQVG